MFDNMQVTKNYNITDSITNNPIPIVTFNSTLNKNSGIKVDMVINYPSLYYIHKDNILVAYREFNSDITSLAVTMGLATTITTSPSILDDLEEVRQQLTLIATETFTQVIASLGDVQVNPVPIMDVGIR